MQHWKCSHFFKEKFWVAESSTNLKLEVSQNSTTQSTVCVGSWDMRPVCSATGPHIKQKYKKTHSAQFCVFVFYTFSCLCLCLNSSYQWKCVIASFAKRFWYWMQLLILNSFGNQILLLYDGIILNKPWFRDLFVFFFSFGRGGYCLKKKIALCWLQLLGSWYVSPLLPDSVAMM